MPSQDRPSSDGLRAPKKAAPAADAGPAEPTADESRLFKALADNAFFGNIVADSDGIIRYANKYFAEVHGYTPEELIGQHFSIVHTPEQVATSRQIMAKALREGTSEPQEHWFLHRDGTTFPLLVGVQTVPTVDGASANFAMSAVDVSAIHQAEAAYQTLFTQMLDGLAHHRIICDDAGAPVDYRFLSVNPAFEEMTGLKATDIVGRTVLEALPGTEQSWIDTYGKVALSGEPTRFESYSAPLDKYFEVTAFSPAPGEFATIFQDVTKARRASEALRTAAEELQRTQRLAKTGSWTWDFAKDEVTWSEELFNVFGIEPALIAPSFSEQEALITPETYAALNEAVAGTVETGVPYEVEIEIPRADGTSRWLWARGEPLTDPDGHRTGLWGAAQDITERKLGEEALRRSEEELQRTQRLAHLGSWSLDSATGSTEWNEILFELFGLDPASGTPTFAEQEALFAPESYRTLVAAVAETMATDIPYELELGIVRADGEPRWAWARGERVVDAAGRPTGLWGAAQDITDRKTQEEERFRLESELARALRLESVGRLAGSVAHDFNNMLTVILGNAERILARTAAEDPLRGEMEEIREAADRSADLTRQLLAFARNQPATPAVIDLNETVAGVLTMLSRLIGEEVDLAWKPGRGLASVRIDPSQVGQILTNLCINARDAIAGTGRIVIETGHASFDQDFCAQHPTYLPGDYVQLAVTDSGSGMDAELLSRVFEPFFSTKESGLGTGLGLATIYGIVKQNDGFASVSSEPGIGTTFCIYLPRVDAAPEPSREPTPALPAGKASGDDEATILLVEDEPAILALATKALEGRGYVVLPASTGADALRLAGEHSGSIDLLLTDVIMPEMNGRTLADELRSTRPNLKVLFMSGYTSDVITGHGTPEGDAEFIAKPFHLKDLAQKVREVLGA